MSHDISSGERKSMMTLMLHLRSLEKDAKGFEVLGDLHFFKDPAAFRRARRALSQARNHPDHDNVAAAQDVGVAMGHLMEWVDEGGPAFEDPGYAAELLWEFQDRLGEEAGADKYSKYVAEAATISRAAKQVNDRLADLWQSMGAGR